MGCLKALCWALALCTKDCQHIAKCSKIVFLQRFQTLRVGLYLLFFPSGNCGLSRSLCEYAEEHLWLQCIKGTAFREKPPQDSHRCYAWRYGWTLGLGHCGGQVSLGLCHLLQGESFFSGIYICRLWICFLFCNILHFSFCRQTFYGFTLFSFVKCLDLGNAWGSGRILRGSHMLIHTWETEEVRADAALVEFTSVSVPWRSQQLGKDLPIDIWVQKWDHWTVLSNLIYKPSLWVSFNRHFQEHPSFLSILFLLSPEHSHSYAHLFFIVYIIGVWKQ